MSPKIKMNIIFHLLDFQAVGKMKSEKIRMDLSFVLAHFVYDLMHRCYLWYQRWNPEYCFVNYLFHINPSTAPLDLTIRVHGYKTRLDGRNRSCWALVTANAQVSIINILEIFLQYLIFPPISWIDIETGSKIHNRTIKY